MARREVTPAWAVTLNLLGPAALFSAYFLVPIGTFGPQHPALSWTVFAAALAAIAGGLLRAIRRDLLEMPGRPVLEITLLLCFALCIFSVTYLGLSRDGQMHGMHTRVDSLYFTVITLATVGYGDITPTGQAARVVVMVQLLYTLVFLAAGGSAITRRLRGRFQQRTEERRHRHRL